MGAVVLIRIAILSGALLGGCAALDSGPTARASSQAGPVLVSATPRPGSTVHGSVDELKLHFSPPARLDEVTVAGPDGLMPAMVHAVGEVADYSIPITISAPGAYTVSWRATAKGREYRGSFAFTVK